MIVKSFDYNQDKKLIELKKINDKCGSKKLKKTFEYLRLIFYHSPKEKIISEIIPNVAYYVATINQKNIRLIDIAVNKEYQKRGIGKFLLNRIKQVAKYKGLNKITLRTSMEEKAFLFWLSQGFIETGVSEEDIEMELTL